MPTWSGTRGGSARLFVYDWGMHILVTAASKHGATDEVADAIARRLTEAGFEVDRIAPGDVDSVEEYDAVVVGSAVYILQWMPAAHDSMECTARELAAKPVVSLIHICRFVREGS